MLTQQTVEYLNQFPALQPWIKKMAELWPVELRALLDRPFGDLGQWMSHAMDTNGRPISGCMVGTFDLVLAEMLGCAVSDYWNTGAGDYILTEFYARCHLKLAEPVVELGGGYSGTHPQLVASAPTELFWFHELTERAGLAAMNLKNHIEDELFIDEDPGSEEAAQARAEAILKEVIRHELGGV